VVYVTERCIFNLEPDGVVLREVAPGLDLQKDILDQIGFNVKVAQDLKDMDPGLFRSELMGLNQLEAWKG
jgi:acyl CoA:acetate/3-ketoacid CoA transferase